MSEKLYNIPTSTVAAKADCKPRPASNVPGTLSAKTGVPSKQGKPTFQTPMSRQIPVDKMKMKNG